MAQTKLEKIGTIFSRVQALLRTGAMKPEDKPLWYDVYEAFPPKYEPRFSRRIPDAPIRQIFYEEDIIRAKFYQDVPKVRALNLYGYKPGECHNFVVAYTNKKKKMPDASNEEIYAVTLNEFKQDSRKVFTREDPRYAIDIEELIKD